LVELTGITFDEYNLSADFGIFFCVTVNQLVAVFARFLVSSFQKKYKPPLLKPLDMAGLEYFSCKGFFCMHQCTELLTL